MRSAGQDDWLCMVFMMKHARAASHPRPTWAFSYGMNPDDAEYSMAMTLLGGCWPYETQSPKMESTAGAEFRTRMFGWLAAHPELVGATTSHQVAVLYSSASRDALFAYPGAGSGLYATTKLPPGEDEAEWWSTDGTDSVRANIYVAESRGLQKALALGHTAYDILTTNRADAETLQSYEVIVAPSPAAISATTVRALVAYVQGGGTLILTGPDAGVYDDMGNAQPTPALLDALGLLPAPTGWVTRPVGKGRVLYTPMRAGAKAFGGDASVWAQVATVMPKPEVTVAPANGARVLFEVRKTPAGDPLLVLANLTGLGVTTGEFTPVDATVRVTVTAAPTRVAVSRPDADDLKVPTTTDATGTWFEVPIHAIALATWTKT